jgi:hypothetical protein
LRVLIISNITNCKAVSSEGSVELEFGSEIERDTDREYEYSEDDNEHEEPLVDPSPDREVFYKNSKNAARNKWRRKRRRIERDQKMHVTARIDEPHVKMRLNNRQKSRSPSDKDTKAKSRSVSPKTEEEADDQDTKVPKNKKRKRRQ